MSMVELGPNLWTVEGATAMDLVVVPYPTRMTVARLTDGGLWVSSPVLLAWEDMGHLLDVGPVRHLVSATPRHHWRLESWHALFPDASLWSCAKGPATLGDRSLPTTVLTDQMSTPWGAELEHALYPGVGFEETTFFHRESGTLIVEDIVQSHPLHDRRPGVNALLRLGGVKDPGGVPRDIRLVTRREPARRWAERVLSWDFDHVVMAHGPVIHSGGKHYVERALDWLID